MTTGGFADARIERRARSAVQTLRDAIESAREAPSDEERCVRAALLAEAIELLARDAVVIRNDAGRALLSGDPPSHRPYQVRELMRVSRARLVQLRRRWGLVRNDE